MTHALMHEDLLYTVRITSGPPSGNIPALTWAVREHEKYASSFP